MKKVKSLEAARIELEQFTDKRCERCYKILKHSKEITEAVYCHRCNGIFCLHCWFIQREEEEK